MKLDSHCRIDELNSYSIITRKNLTLWFNELNFIFNNNKDEFNSMEYHHQVLSSSNEHNDKEMALLPDLRTFNRICWSWITKSFCDEKWSASGYTTGCSLFPSYLHFGATSPQRKISDQILTLKLQVCSTPIWSDW